jgi:hypothetical protein
MSRLCATDSRLPTNVRAALKDRKLTTELADGFESALSNVEVADQSEDSRTQGAYGTAGYEDDHRVGNEYVPAHIERNWD